MSKKDASSTLLKDERLQMILEKVRDTGKATVVELSEHFEVSDITIRRDLKELAEQGLIRRAHGGAVYSINEPDDPPVIQRMLQNRDAKERIGRATAALINDNESVFIGSGSTATYVARHLMERQNLTVITNAISIATELAAARHLTVVVLGGMLRPSELSMVGHITEQALREVRMNKVVIGIGAISLKAGLTSDYMPEVMTDRAIFDMASNLILVADHSKFGNVASAYVASVDRITTLVTDNQTDPEMLTSIRSMGVHVIVA
jgi:DeoR/GlpR family transcriptional regulator of sugar metabolism